MPKLVMINGNSTCIDFNKVTYIDIFKKKITICLDNGHYFECEYDNIKMANEDFRTMVQILAGTENPEI